MRKRKAQSKKKKNTEHVQINVMVIEKEDTMERATTPLTWYCLVLSLVIFCCQCGHGKMVR